ncbi:hypothetical protein ACHHYP_10332 [Achlya hypogyna]|uniref:Uncharacterized protein n=1 Tax=Achlya hypogyna TaxID=1202772 RepID=A0A1V9YLR1_ACHHY|nr:hypothetical protein ACHHYP_10332 [Achlya hypogyna]
MTPDHRLHVSADAPLPRLHHPHGAPEAHRPQPITHDHRPPPLQHDPRAQYEHRPQYDQRSPHTSPSPSEQQQVYPLRRENDAYYVKPHNVDPTSPTAVWRARRREEAAAGGAPYPPPDATSYGRGSRNDAYYVADWRQESSGHERASSRKRVEHALRSHARNYDELLLIISAIDEELLHISSNSKMQYFDSAMDFQRTLESGCTSYRL